MVNTAKASTIYIGVENAGTVVGVRMDRKERDILSVDIDNLMREFKPCIKHDRYEVSCISVLNSKFTSTFRSPGALHTSCLQH